MSGDLISLHAIGSKTLGGAERFCIRLLDALRERGETVSVLARRGSEVVGAIPGGIPVTESPMRTVWDPWSKRAVSRAIADIRPDIVQTYMGRATRLTRLREGRGPIHVARLGGYYKLDGYRHAHAWIGNTRGVCDYMIANGLPADRVFHIGNFIDLPRTSSDDERTRLRTAWGIPRDAYVLMTAGRFVEVKGHRFLLDALAQLPVRLNDRPVRLLLLGDGILGPRLREQAARLGVDERIVWAGWQSDPAPFYEIADLVVFPSLEQETLGNVILEAWAHRKPIVVSRFRGAREITRDGVDAWQVPCEDAIELAAGVRHVAGQPGLAAAMAEQGFDQVRRDFSRAAVAGAYIDLYGELRRRQGRRDVA